jgi:hypothetical protein
MRSLYRLVVFGIALIGTGLSAQTNEVRISGTRMVAAGETFTVSAGSTVVFEPGASLLVDGNIKLVGSSDKRIKIISADSKNPGLGISIEGVSESGRIEIENVDFVGLVQPLRFDPFWYRKSVEISNSNFSDISYGEPIMYVSAPLLDLRDGKIIEFDVKNTKFFNNTDNIILEKVGSAGIRYNLSNITLNDNNLHGEDGSMGMLHLDFSKDANQANIALGDFVIVNNTSGNAPIGISVSGGPGDKLVVPTGTVYSNASSSAIVYDSRRDKRLPALGIENTSALSSMKSPQDFVLGASHVFGRLALSVSGNPTLVKLVDTFNRPVFVKQDRVGDSLIVTYLEGNPAIGTIQNGLKFRVPALTAKQLPPPLYRKVDTTLISPKWPDTLNAKDVSFKIKIPTFGRKTPITVLKNWELGFWGGGGIYGGGDIKHKFAPLMSTMEISGGVYGQYNINSRFSLKASYYHTSISMHNLYATGLFTGGLSPIAVNLNYENFSPFGNAWSVMFVTPMNIVEGEMIWHLKDYAFKAGKKSRFVPSIGLSFGVLQYTPYRYAYKSQRGSETYAQYVDRMNEQYKFDLRKLGSEGQNFLPGQEQYGQLAANVGATFMLSYIRKKWSFKGEIKSVYTTTDYLDDFGPGLWYGGSYQLMRDNQQAVDPNSPEYLANLNKISAYSPDINPATYRSTNGLNDWYFQMHMGISYNLEPKKKKAEIVPISTEPVKAK